MLFSTNHIVSISSLSTGAKRTWSVSSTGVAVYINQIQEDLVQWYDGAGSFTAYRMMTDGTHTTIDVGDRITDENNNIYEVRAKSISDDIMGVHHQYILIIKYD